MKKKKIHYQDTRAYIEFKSKCEEIPSCVNLGVYLAVQMRLLRLPLHLERYSANAAHEKLKQLKQAAIAQRQHYGSMTLSQDLSQNLLKISLPSICGSADGNRRGMDGSKFGSSIIIPEESEDEANLESGENSPTLYHLNSTVISNSEVINIYYIFFIPWLTT